MKRPSSRWVSAAWLCIAVWFAGSALWDARGDYAYQYAFDLYHPWGIATARDAAHGPVNPYADTPAVGAIAYQRASSASSRTLNAASGFWLERSPVNRFEPTGTPLYYALFAGIPRDYDVAHRFMAILQFVGLAAGVYMLARVRGWGIGASACAAAFALATFNPFTQDVKFGNVNSLQFFVVAALIAVAHPGLLERSRTADLLYLPALAFFVLAKPNTGLVALALVAHYFLSRGPQRLVRGLLLSAVALAGGIAIGAAYFGGLGIWRDWYLYTQGLNGGTLMYTAREGNLSIVKMLSETGHAFGVTGYVLAAAVVLGAAMLLALSSRGKEPGRILPGIRAVLADPWLAASAAVLATFLLSPLMWPHYWVMALVPLLRLFRWHGRWDLQSVCAALAYALMSRPVLEAIYDPRRDAAIYTFMMFSWTPLIAALLAEFAAAASPSPPATARSAA